jgi:hypothetical protein
LVVAALAKSMISASYEFIQRFQPLIFG